MEPSVGVGVLWLLMIGWMFYALHLVCDVYFVPAINVFVQRMRRSENRCLQRWGEESVAGATLCAFGCNGPELFSNWVSLYTGSNAGIGVVVGSEIFNLLVIIGCTIMAAPETPLGLERAPFVRDIAFYALSIALLYWALRDEAIEFYESTTLLCASVLYAVTVYFTSDIVACFKGLGAVETEPEQGAVRQGSKPTGKVGGVEVEVEEIVHSRMADSRQAGASSEWHLDPQSQGIHAESIERKGATPRSRAMGFMFDHPHALLGQLLRYEDLKEVIYEQGLILLDFHHNLQHVTLKVAVKTEEQRDELLGCIHTHTQGRVWLHPYDGTARGVWNRLLHTLRSPSNSFIFKVLAIPEFVTMGALTLTLWYVDVKDISKEGRWALCFAGSMIWLALLAYLMLEFTNQVQYNIPVLPSSFLGLTVCAIGTSFPNAVASVLMAQQNKPAAAVANALGSNVQNVFLAMALPWVAYGLQTGAQPINQDVAGIQEGVYWMMGTLALVVLMAVVPPACALQWSFGPILVAVYVVYLIQASGETFGWWPAMVN